MLRRLLLTATLTCLIASSSAQTSPADTRTLPPPPKPITIRNVVFWHANLLTARERLDIRSSVRENASHSANFNEELGGFDEGLKLPVLPTKLLSGLASLIKIWATSRCRWKEARHE